ncbi:tat pathway signal sequence [Aspergillus luchuensis IFO 4308]|nr:tat pathway signal sequence [Aspergillus luchuensis IFO 4308]
MSEKTYKIWNHSFKWTSDHIPAEGLQSMRYSYDVLGEECYLRLKQIVSKPSHGPTEQAPLNPDLYTLLRDNYTQDKKLRKLWGQVHSIPDWVDWAQIERGHLASIEKRTFTDTAKLAFQGLIGAMGPGRGAETLARTSGLGRQTARRRILETAQFILEVTQSLSALQPGGTGQIACLRVRFLHAIVRTQFMALIQRDSSQSTYNVKEHGIPINDIDSIVTVLDLSAVILLIGLPAQGIYPSNQEVSDCIAMWRLVAHYMGTPSEPFKTPHSAKVMLESYLVAEMHPTENSGLLARNIFRALDDALPYVPRSLLMANTYWLNGSELSNQLGFEGTTRAWSLVLSLVYGVFVGLIYLCRLVPWLDEGHIKLQRRLQWYIIVEGKTGLGKRSTFKFKNKPQLQPPQSTRICDKTWWEYLA